MKRDLLAFQYLAAMAALVDLLEFNIIFKSLEELTVDTLEKLCKGEF